METDNEHCSPESVAEQLFSQLTQARDEAQQGGIIDEDIFNDRLNQMYVAGYMIGYIDACMDEETADQDKKEFSRLVLEKMFPDTGFDFVRAKMVTRQKARVVEPNSEMYQSAVIAAQSFDAGMEKARAEIAAMLDNSTKVPVGLKNYLLLGETYNR